MAATIHPRFVTIVDYGMGNLRSLARALERSGAIVSVSDDPRTIARAERLVIPGQGAFGQAMSKLSSRGLIPILREALAASRPLLGICLGLQILFEASEEASGVPGLGVFEGRVERLPLAPGIKCPHMGWAPVEHACEHPAIGSNSSGEAFYFVHSYAVRSSPVADYAAATHGIRFLAALARGPLVATQFHPEKSQDAGERLLRAWLDL